MVKLKEIKMLLKQMDIPFSEWDNGQGIDIPACYLHPRNAYSPDSEAPDTILYKKELSFLKDDHRVRVRLCENCSNCDDLV